MANLESPEWWALQKFVQLRMKNPVLISRASSKAVEFVCDCGKSKLIRVRDVVGGKTKSCGKCDEMESHWWASQKFGKLVVEFPKDGKKGSSRKQAFRCECGNKKDIRTKDVTSRKVTSCGLCNLRHASWWSEARFGRLRLKNPKTLHTGSGRKETFICNCGHEKKHAVNSVTSGKASSCGRCSMTLNEWFYTNRDIIRALKAPVEPEQIPSGGPTLLDTAHNLSKSARVRCRVCGSIYKLTISHLKGGKSLSCGCAAGWISKPCIEIRRHLQDAGFNVDFEYLLEGYRYDLLVRESKLLIEFDGEMWHSTKKSDRIDSKKKALAEVHGYGFLRICEKNWKSNKAEVKKLILDNAATRKRLDHSYMTKGEIVVRLNELEAISSLNPSEIHEYIRKRRNDLKSSAKYAYEDIMSAAISSHHVMCEVKNMKPDEAFGNNPFIYYSLGLVGEAGELSGAVLRALRNGASTDAIRTAVESEIADCFIYTAVLAYAGGIDLVKLVNEKARVVETRARSGYYGGSLESEGTK